jgi:hypothetical protein
MQIAPEAVKRSALRCKERWTWLAKQFPAKYGPLPTIQSMVLGEDTAATTKAITHQPVVIEEDPCWPAIQAMEWVLKANKT